MRNKESLPETSLHVLQQMTGEIHGKTYWKGERATTLDGPHFIPGSSSKNN